MQPRSQSQMEDLALSVLQQPDTKQAITTATQRLKTLVGHHAPEEAWVRLNSVMTEWAFNYSLKAVNSDPNYPAVLQHIFSAPYSRQSATLPGNRGFGGDNPDTDYIIIPIDNRAHFRISGTLPARGVDLSVQICADASLSSQLALLHADEIQRDKQRRFTLDIAPQKPEGADNYLRAPIDSRYLLLRETRGDWSLAGGNYQVQRLTPPAVPPISDEEIAQRAQRSIVHEVPTAYFWLAMVNQLPENHFTPAFITGKVGGMDNARMSMARLKLKADEAIVLHIDPAKAKYLGVVLMDYWQRSIEPAQRVSSLTQDQAIKNSDGRITLVIAAEDPGVHNWLDTAGLSDTKIMVRWQSLPAGELAADHLVSAEKVSLAEVRSASPGMTPSQRQQQLETRKSSFYSKYQ